MKNSYSFPDLRRTVSTLTLLGALIIAPNVGCSDPATPETKPATETKPVAANKWEKDIVAFEEADKRNFPPADAAVFVGSSSIRFWETLAKDFPEIPTIRRGFGGSQLSDSVLFADRIVIPYKPRLVVVYAGSNDVAVGVSPKKVLERFQEFAAKVHAALPNTHIAFISINPSIKREKQVEAVCETNSLVEAWVKDKPNLAYINSFDGLLGPDGRAQASLLMNDGLHLNKTGYTKWVEIVKPTILKLYETAPR